MAFTFRFLECGILPALQQREKVDLSLIGHCLYNICVVYLILILDEHNNVFKFSFTRFWIPPRPFLVWDVMGRMLIAGYRRFGTIFLSYCHRSNCLALGDGTSRLSSDISYQLQAYPA